MKYILSIALTSDTFHERTDRFLQTGAPPPPGVTMLGRWHALGLDQLFILVESDHPAAVFAWAAEWGDMIEMEVIPVIEDDEAAAALQAVRG